jgi:predicted nuclease of predicted toxin-antitoxin system
MKPRFLLDEHINRAVQRQLRRLDLRIEVLAVGDPNAPPRGASDEEILRWIEENGYILVTENRSTMPGHLAEHFKAGRHIPGLLWIRLGIGIGRIVEELYLIWFASEAEEYYDRALFIPL